MPFLEGPQLGSGTGTDTGTEGKEPGVSVPNELCMALRNCQERT